MYRFFNSAVGAFFGSILAFCCYRQADGMISSLDERTLTVYGFIVFLALLVTSWLVLDVRTRTTNQ